MSNRSKKSRDEFLAEIKAFLKESLEIFQVNVDIADKVATETTKKLTKNWGGVLIYIPKGSFQDNEKRDKKIKSQFNGNNHVELCRRYNLSLQRVYEILRES